MGNEDDTPINNQLIEYKLGELFAQNNKLLDKMDNFLTAFNAHTSDDAVMADRLVRLEEDRKAAVGMWSGVGGALAAAGSVVYAAIFGGK